MSIKSAFALTGAVLAGSLGLAACGDDDKTSTTTAAPATATATTTAAAAASDTADSAAGAADPRAAIAAWFTAARTGDTEAKCALETEDFKVLQYDTVEGCLTDAANTQPQAVWAEEVPIVSLDEQGANAVAIVSPNAGGGAEAQVGLVKQGDVWLVNAFQ